MLPSEMNRPRLFVVVVLVALCANRAGAQLILSGNENKIALTSGAPKVIGTQDPDSITLLNFATFPPSVQHVANVPNSVIGPPSNVAITPDRRLALMADSIKIDSQDPTKWLPESFVHVIDLKADPPKVIGRVGTGLQPSGISIRSDGKLALVANRAEGTITVLSIHGSDVKPTQTLKVCEPPESLSDVAIHPNGRLALASAQKGGFLAVLNIAGGHVTATRQKLSAYGQPYRCVITPDGALGLTAGQGYGNGIDRDAITVIDLNSTPMRTVDYIPIGAVPESIETSPDGKLLAAVAMNGSNLALSDPNRSANGKLVLLMRRGKTFRVVEEHSIGRIPEGVAFTSDGKHLVVQCHPDRELWIFSVKGGRLKDTGQRIKVPGMPSSLRASP